MAYVGGMTRQQQLERLRAATRRLKALLGAKRVPPLLREFVPEEDITAYELALLLQPQWRFCDVTSFDMMPDQVKRHWKVRKSQP